MLGVQRKVSISKSSILQDIFTVLYNIVKDNVTDPKASSRTRWTYSSYSDAPLDSKEDYPLIIFDPAEMAWDEFTLTKKWAMISFTITLFTINNRQIDTISTDIIEAIETNRATLKFTDSLYNVNLESRRVEEFTKNGMKVHMSEIRFSMKFPFSKTQGT